MFQFSVLELRYFIHTFFSHSFLCKISRYTISCCFFFFWGGKHVKFVFSPSLCDSELLKCTLARLQPLCFVGNFHGESIILSLLVYEEVETSRTDILFLPLMTWLNCHMKYQRCSIVQGVVICNYDNNDDCPVVLHPRNSRYSPCSILKWLM